MFIPLERGTGECIVLFAGRLTSLSDALLYISARA